MKAELKEIREVVEELEDMIFEGLASFYLDQGIEQLKLAIEELEDTEEVS